MTIVGDTEVCMLRQRDPMSLGAPGAYGKQKAKKIEIKRRRPAPDLAAIATRDRCAVWVALMHISFLMYFSYRSIL